MKLNRNILSVAAAAYALSGCSIDEDVTYQEWELNVDERENRCTTLSEELTSDVDTVLENTAQNIGVTLSAVSLDDKDNWFVDRVNIPDGITEVGIFEIKIEDAPNRSEFEVENLEFVVRKTDNLDLFGIYYHILDQGTGDRYEVDESGLFGSFIQNNLSLYNFDSFNDLNFRQKFTVVVELELGKDYESELDPYYTRVDLLGVEFKDRLGTETYTQPFTVSSERYDCEAFF